MRSIEVTAYDKNFQLVGSIGRYESCKVIQRFNQAGSATLVLPSDHIRVANLVQPGARATFKADGIEFSGPVSSFSGKGPSSQATIEFEFADDFERLGEFLCWVVPGAGITEQGTAGIHDERTGPIETLIKGYTRDNAVTRLGMPITIAPDQGRGPTHTLKMRWYTLADKVFPVVDGLGLVDGTLGVSLVQRGASILLDCYETSNYAQKLSEAAGNISEWSFKSSAPLATDVVIGGQGEAQLRLTRTVTDAARIAEWNRRIERWRDARDTDDPTTMYARGNETLEEGQAKAGVSVTLRESEGFKFGQHIHLGDRISVDVAPGVTLGPEILREVTVSLTRAGGYKVEPSLGEREDEPVLVQAVRDIARYLRRVHE